ncbi:MAG: DUF2939 domain-containing protein [Pseudomonadota bacterium]
MKHSKKITIIFSILVLFFLAFTTAAGPFITLHSIKTSVENHDATKLKKNIDTELLRQNLKSQFQSIFETQITARIKENPQYTDERMRDFALSMAAKAFDAMIDGMVSPESFALFLSEKPKASLNSEGKPTTTVDTIAQMQTNAKIKIKYKFDSLNKFYVTKKVNGKDDVIIVLTRYGVSWKVSNIIFPHY